MSHTHCLPSSVQHPSKCVCPMQPVRLVSMAIVAASPVLSVSTVMGCAIMSPATVNVSLVSLAPSAIKVGLILFNPLF